MPPHMPPHMPPSVLRIALPRPGEEHAPAAALQACVADWPVISGLLDEVLELPSEQRVGWVAALRGERQRFRATLTALLVPRTGIETDDFLQRLPCLQDLRPQAAPAEPQPGDRVGPYRLLQPLAQGGMGAVWLAERASGWPQGLLALKLPRLTWGDRYAERLKRESQILASLSHPNIAGLHEAGLDAYGRPFLALSYVEGLPIDQHVARHQPSLPARVALLLQVMAAVSHAHARQVVAAHAFGGARQVELDDL